MDEQNTNLPLKVVLIGGPSVGKTCLIQRFYKDTYNDISAPTIHANCIQKQISTNKGPVILEVWDTAGQEKFRSISPLFFRNALGCISVFDSTSEQSLSDAFDYINDFLDSSPDGKVVVCGNKVDLLTTQPDDNELIRKAEEQCNIENFPLFLASAKTGEGINEVFMSIATAITDSNTNEQQDSVKIKQKKNKDKKGCC